MAKRGSVKTFIENAIKIHQGVYDYSNVVYVNSRTLVSIICPKHGAFLKSPNNHLSGQGCPQCTSDRIGRTPNMDTHKFIMRAKSIHGEKYIYDDVVYVNNTEKVNIYCPKHGIFRQRPNDHLRGKGCPVCFSERLGRIHVMNTGVFIQRAKEIHKDKYDYSKVQYKNMATKVEIICPIHGIFMQRPSDHLKGKGCTKCACEKMKIVKSMTKEEFISRATVIHKAKYNYDKVEIINGRKKVAIICPVHGVFYQSPEVHLQQKCGCKKCADEKNADKLRLSKEDFISRAISIHGRKYDYADVNYINSNTKVKIKCPIHGTFLQAPSVHINQKCGCPKCAIALNASEKRKTTDAFVREARTMHGDKYDYSKTKYVNSNTLVEIVCKIHGSFFQLPTIHLRQNGGNCPKCVGKYKTTEDFIKEAQEIHGNK